MLQLAFFRDQKDRVTAGLKKRNWTEEKIKNTVDEVLMLDDKNRSTQTALDATLAEINQLTKKILVKIVYQK
jgi:seryl-tRNA synthetase